MREGETPLQLKRNAPTAFTPLVLAGSESFASAFQASFLNLSDADSTTWLDVIEQTGRTPEGLGYADHYLFIGRR